MATLIEWSQVRARIDRSKADYDYDSDTLALAHVVLEHDLDLTKEEIDDATTDGGNDRGVDAVYIDEHDDDETTIHIYQIKAVTTFDNAKKNFPGGEVDKILSYIADMLHKSVDEQTVNRMLWQKTKEMWAAYDRRIPRLVVHFCANQEPVTGAERARLLAALGRYSRTTFEEHTLSTISERIIEKKRPRIDADLRIVDDNYFERVDGNIRGLIATIEAKALVDLIRDPDKPDRVRESIFDDNLRIYLTTKNPINQRILKSALSETNYEFWYLNNGITITCDSLEYAKHVRGPIAKLTNIQIVNGGQTSNALFEAHRSDPEKLPRNCLVLVRIYETKSSAISQLIAETTNSQTPVRNRDLRANDSVQLKLEDAFLSRGYFYERKTNQYRDMSREKRIDALAAGQAYTAYHLDLPDVAKKDKRRIFDDLYQSIFNEDLTPERLLVPFLIHSKIDERKRSLQGALRNNRSYERAHLILIDGVYHVLFAVRRLMDLKGIDENDVERGLAEIENAIGVVAKTAVAAESQEEAAFTTSRFFKERRTAKRIEETAREYVG